MADIFSRAADRQAKRGYAEAKRQSEETKTYSFRLTKSLHKSLAQLAADRETTMSALIEEACRVHYRL